MNLKSKILSILKEDDENLFKPRKISDREEKAKKEKEELLKKYPGIEKIYYVSLSFGIIEKASSEYVVKDSTSLFGYYIHADNEQIAFDKGYNLSIDDAILTADRWTNYLETEIKKQIGVYSQYIERVVDEDNVLENFLDERTMDRDERYDLFDGSLEYIQIIKEL
jgi:hypothetical protein